MARLQHYRFSHKLLPGLFHKNPLLFFEQMRSQQGQMYLLEFWESIAEDLDFDAQHIVEATGLRITYKKEKDYGLLVISLPPPQESPEAYFIGLWSSYCDKHEGSPFRYFTLELGQDLESEDDSLAHLPVTFFCEWTKEGERLNYGNGSAPSIQKFIEEIEKFVLPEADEPLLQEISKLINPTQAANQTPSIEGTTWKWSADKTVMFLPGGNVFFNYLKAGGHWQQEGDFVRFDCNNFTIYEVTVNNCKMTGRWYRAQDPSIGNSTALEKVENTSAGLTFNLDLPTPLRNQNSAFQNSNNSGVKSVLHSFQRGNPFVDALFRIIRWLLVGLTTVLLWSDLMSNHYLPVLLMTASIIILLPWTEGFLEWRVPSLVPRFKRLLIWFVLLAVALVAFPRPWIQLQRHIEEYTNIPNLERSSAILNQDSDEIKAIDGKVVVVDKFRKKVPGAFISSLPAKLKPNSPEEVKFVVWLEYNTTQVGTYSDGDGAYQVSCYVTLINKASKKVLEKRQFFGSAPPSMKDSKSSGFGGSPDRQIRAYLSSLAK